MPQDEDRPLIGRQVTEAALELIPLGDGALAIRRGHGLASDTDLGEVPRPVPLRGSVAGVDEQAMQPAIEPIRIAQGPEIAPRQEQRILDGVRGQILVAQDQSSGGVEPARSARRQRRERVDVAVLRSDDEITLLPALPL